MTTDYIILQGIVLIVMLIGVCFCLAGWHSKSMVDFENYLGIGVLLIMFGFITFGLIKCARDDVRCEAVAANAAHYEQVVNPDGTVQNQFAWGPAKK